VGQVFDGPPVPDAERLIELDDFCRPDSVTLLRLAEVFESPVTFLAPYSDESINRKHPLNATCRAKMM